jgi:hypothetical protein
MSSTESMQLCFWGVSWQVLPLLEAVMGAAGSAEVPGAGSVAIGRTQLDRLLRVIPKPASVSMNQLRLAANIAGQDQVRTALSRYGLQQHCLV